MIIGSAEQAFKVGIHVVLLHEFLDHDEICFAAVSEEVVWISTSTSAVPDRR